MWDRRGLIVRMSRTVGVHDDQVDGQLGDWCLG